MGASFTGVPQRRESKCKSIAHTTFGSSAVVIGFVQNHARLRLVLRDTREPSSRHIRCLHLAFHNVAFGVKFSPGALITLT
jgi:hypothetical protein